MSTKPIPVCVHRAIEFLPADRAQILSLNIVGPAAMVWTWSRKGAIEKLRACTDWAVWILPDAELQPYDLHAREPDGDIIHFEADLAKVAELEAFVQGGGHA